MCASTTCIGRVTAPCSQRETAYFFPSPAGETMQAVGKTMVIVGGYRSHALVKLARLARHYIIFLTTEMICCSLVKRESDSWICCGYVLPSGHTSPSSAWDFTDLFTSRILREHAGGFPHRPICFLNDFVARGSALTEQFSPIRDESWWIVMHCLTDISLICFHMTRHVQRSCTC